MPLNNNQTNKQHISGVYCTIQLVTKKTVVGGILTEINFISMNHMKIMNNWEIFLEMHRYWKKITFFDGLDY